MVKVRQFVNSILNSLTYLLTLDDSKQCWLVDCGDTEELINVMRAEGLSLRGILLSHAHFDHIYGINEMLEAFPSAAVFTTIWGKEALESEKLNLSRYHERPFNLQYGDRCVLLDNGKELSMDRISPLCEVELWPSVYAQVMFAPGHNPSCLVFKIEDMYFTGDAYIPEINVVTNIPRADKAVAWDTYRKIKTMCEGKQVFSGHWISEGVKRSNGLG